MFNLILIMVCLLLSLSTKASVVYIKNKPVHDYGSSILSYKDFNLKNINKYESFLNKASSQLAYVNEITNLKSSIPAKKEDYAYDLFHEVKHMNNLKRKYIRYNFYSQSNWTPPKIAFYGKSNYSLWDGLFLWYMLDHYQEKDYQLFFYNHQNSPGMKSFENDVKRFSNIDQSPSNNLYKLKQIVKNFKRHESRSYRINNVSDAVLIYKNYISFPSLNNLNIGIYNDNKSLSYKNCEQIKNSNNMDFEVGCLKNNSQKEKVNNFVNGDESAVFINSDLLSDALNTYQITFPKFQGIIYKQLALYMLVDVNTALDNFNDFKKNPSSYHVYILGQNAKDSLAILSNVLNKNIFKNAVTYNKTFQQFQNLKNDTNAVIFFECESNCALLGKINSSFKNKYKLLPFNIWKAYQIKDINGNSVYYPKKLSIKYPNLEDKYYFNNTTNLFLNQYLIFSDFWLKQNREYSNELQNYFSRKINY